MARKYVGVEYATEDFATALKIVTRRQIERVARVAAELAKARRKRVTIVHKVNVLRLTDGLFRKTARRILEAEDVNVDELYVDVATMDLVRRPETFDVILTLNQYGDILSDLAAEVASGIGLAPSANIGDSKAMFEPVQGAAWDIAGKGIANLTAMILSIALMLEWFGHRSQAGIVWEAVEHMLSSDCKTPDLGGKCNTIEYGRRVADVIRCKCNR